MEYVNIPLPIIVAVALLLIVMAERIFNTGRSIRRDHEDIRQQLLAAKEDHRRLRQIVSLHEKKADATYRFADTIAGLVQEKLVKKLATCEVGQRALLIRLQAHEDLLYETVLRVDAMTKTDGTTTADGEIMLEARVIEADEVAP